MPTNYEIASIPEWLADNEHRLFCGHKAPMLIKAGKCEVNGIELEIILCQSCYDFVMKSQG